MQPGFRRKVLLLLVIVAPVVAAALYLRSGLDPRHVIDRHPEVATTARERTPDHLRVLFIGNSFTFVNGGLPLILQRLVESARAVDPAIQPIIVERVTVPGASLEDLWDAKLAVKRIGEGNWDVVVLQDHSQQPLKHREKMFEYVAKFDTEAKKAGARTVLYMTWSLRKRPQDQSAIAEAYEQAGRRIGATVVPVGRTWETVRGGRPALGLYDRDDKHPSPAGSYLTACLFYATFYGRSPAGLTETIADRGITFVGVPEADATYLQTVAARAAGVTGPTTSPAVVGTGMP